ncbi:MAG: signal peptidase I [Nitriliruptor sp.]|nr:MAG: signal peptidase I [Nitriliruptor sp.]
MAERDAAGDSDDRLFGPAPRSSRPPARPPAPPKRPVPNEPLAPPTPRSDAADPDAPLFAGGPSAAETPPQPPASPPADDGSGGDTPSPRPSRRQASSSGSFLRELPMLLVVALVLAFLLRTFVVQVFYIPSSSMEPTLSVNDRMIVEKITYRFREPVRGEIVVFEGESLVDRAVEDTTGERLVRVVGQFLGVVPASARDFVKRVIGLPGDEILIRDGVVSVNGVPIDEPYVVFDDPSDYGPVTVPEGSLFFLGDNRPNSSDSRRGLGFVPEDKVVGRSYAIIWPFGNAGLLTGVEHELDGATAVADPRAVTATVDPSEAGATVVPAEVYTLSSVP